MAFLSRCASSSLRHSIFVLETVLYPPQLGPTQHFVTLSNSETSSLGRSLTPRTRNSHLQSSLPHLWPKNEVVGCAQVHTETWNFSASGAHFYSLSLRARAADDAFFPSAPLCERVAHAWPPARAFLKLCPLHFWFECYRAATLERVSEIERAGKISGFRWHDLWVAVEKSRCQRKVLLFSSLRIKFYARIIYVRYALFWYYSYRCLLYSHNVILILDRMNNLPKVFNRREFLNKWD